MAAHSFGQPVLRAALLILLSPVLAAAPAQTTGAARPHPKVSATIPGLRVPMGSRQIFTHVLFNQLEGRTDGGEPEFRWDGEGWTGGDMNRLWLKSEGFVRDGVMSDGDQEALYDRPIPRLKYFDAQAGVRADLDSYPRRTWAAVGIEGIAPYFFEFEPTFYIRGGGHVAGRIEGSYDLLITQRLVVQPEAELNFYSKDDPARRIGSGFSDLDTGLRFRYEINRKFAPYIGWAYHGEYGNTARYARQDGESTGLSEFVFGIRAWY